MKILFFSDPHNADISPAMREASYTDDLIKKQEFLVKPSKKADMVICGGDVFHTKRTDKVSYKLVNRLLEIYREYGEMIVLVGNHDSGGESDVDARPLGVFSHLPNVKVVSEEFILKEDLGMLFMCIGGHKEYDSVSLTQVLKRMLTNSIAKLEDKDEIFRIIISHAPIITGLSDDYPFPTIPFKSVGKYAHLFLIGHLHNFILSNNRVLSAGSLARGVLSFNEDFYRKVYYGMADINGLECETSLHEIPVRDPSEVFKVAEKQTQLRQEQAEASIVDFIASLGEVNMADREDIKKKILSCDADPAVKERAVQILDGV